MKNEKLIFLVCGFLAIVTGLLASSVVDRKYEVKVQKLNPTGEIKELESDNSKWAKNYPLQYESFMKTKDGAPKHDVLKEDPNLVILWAGYGFSKDYNAPAGHAYAIEDIQNTLRTGAPKGPNDGPMPNTCWTCKSPDVPRVMAEIGPEAFYKGKWASLGHEVTNPIGCADCHDAKTMELTITRPALVEAFERRGEDINKVSYQDKRTLVCAQCHVEYYFKGKNKYLTFPWDKGLGTEDMEAYYDEYAFKDWTHKLSKAPMLKAQHPGYEFWKRGIHGKRGVSCVDCHMPYTAKGGVKFTDHHARSPLENINNSCQTCHRQSEDELLRNVADMKKSATDLKNRAEKSLVKAHLEAEHAWKNGAKEEDMKEVLKLIRHSQWRWDMAVASHGGYFHAPEETLRVLGTSIEKSKDARILLERVFRKLNVPTPVKLADVSTKAKAQKYIGLDVEKLKKEKEEFKKMVKEKWLKK
jgi:nitrite reductase (cytochrome c-552)